MIVRSPRLRKDLGSLACRGREYFCWCGLALHVKMPISSGYEVEASSRQWKDGSGTRVSVRLDESGCPWYSSDFTDGRWFMLELAIRRYLRKLGCKPGGPAKVVYFRLLYEE